MIELYYDGNFVSRHRSKEKAFEAAFKALSKNGFPSLGKCDFRITKNPKNYSLSGEFRDWFYQPLFFFEDEENFLDMRE
jgi:hypothetical protein